MTQTVVPVFFLEFRQLFLAISLFCIIVYIGLSVIDFTRYDLPAKEPPGQHACSFSLMGRINQKGTRPKDAPVAFDELSGGDKRPVKPRDEGLVSVPTRIRSGVSGNFKN